MWRSTFVGVLIVGLLLSVAAVFAGPTAQDTPGPLTRINQQLAAQGSPIRAEEVEYFTLGQARPANRVHTQPFRWVANDDRRAADGANITYLVDSDGRTSSGLSSRQTEAAIDRAMTTWANDDCTANFEIIKRTANGDVDIYDSFFGYGRYGDPFVADIVDAGWYPREFFEAAGGPGGGRGILAFSVSFIFTDDAGNPTDINGDNYLDTALNEVYYNDTFGNRRTDRAGNPWGIDILLPGIDVETVALHENGHSLGLGHFGPPPDAVMNPVYAGIRHTPYAADDAGLCAIYNNWPND
jgi:hypothetical protein